MQIEVFESAPSALNQLVRVRGDGAQPGGRATGGPARAHARGPGGRTGGCGQTGARSRDAGGFGRAHARTNNQNNSFIIPFIYLNTFIKQFFQHSDPFMTLLQILAHRF